MPKKLKDKKIIIYEETKTGSPGDMPRMGYIPIHHGSLWAYIRQLSASEFYAAKATQQTEEIIFIVNYRPDITPKCCISYRGVFYDITRVDAFEGYKADLHLYATIKQSQPGASDIYPYPGT